MRRLESGRSRVEVVDELTRAAETDAELVVGLDFAFSLPAWYLAELRIETARDLWARLAEESLTARMRELGLGAWMQAPDWPFWKLGRPADLTAERRFRRTELDVAGRGIQPKSVFQLVGGGQVGPASLYGMQALHVLSQRGFGIWPFDAPSAPLVVEIFPRTLTGAVVKSDAVARER